MEGFWAILILGSGVNGLQFGPGVQAASGLLSGLGTLCEGAGDLASRL